MRIIEFIPNGSEGTRLEPQSAGTGKFLSRDESSDFFPVPDYDNTFVEGPDTEGGRRIKSRPTNSTGTFKAIVSGASQKEFQRELDEFQTMVESMRRNKGVLEYTPEDGNKVTYEVEAMKISSAAYDGVLMRGWVQAFTVEFVCLPYGLLDSETVVSEQELTGPVDTVVLSDVPGHVDARAELTLTDTDGEIRNYINWGSTNEYDTSDEVVIPASDLIVSGFLGTFSSDRISADTASVWTAICGTEDMGHVGLYRVKAVVQTEDTDTRIRFSYSVGDGPVSVGPETQVQVPNREVLADLGTINIQEVEGTHSWSGQIEFTRNTENPGNQLDIVQIRLIPSNRGGTARSPFTISTPSSFTSQDDFESHTVDDPITGKSLPVGGDWSGDGNSEDFLVSDAGDEPSIVRNLESSVDSDLYSGRYITDNASSSIANTSIQTIANQTVGGSTTETSIIGLLARYTDVDNWLFFGWKLEELVDSSAPLEFSLQIIKRVSGTVSVLTNRRLSSSSGVFGWNRLHFEVTDSGMAVGWMVREEENFGLPSLATNDPDLSTGGNLDSGRVGLYQATTKTVRHGIFKEFSAWEPSFNPVIKPNQSMKLDYQKTISENSTGTRWNRVNNYTGKRFFLPPGDSRLAVEQDIDDVGGGFPVEDDGNTLDATVTVTPRVVLLG